MNYQQLIDQHDDIQRLIDRLLVQLQCAAEGSHAAEAVQTLTTLGAAVREHLAQEEPLLPGMANAAAGARHEATVGAAMAELDRTRQGWTAYFARWTPASIADDWAGFTTSSRLALAELRDQLEREGSILYSLAVFYEVLPVA